MSNTATNSLYERITAKLPTSVTKGVRGLTVATLIGQIVLIGTGGLVRLTSSGLGCPTWPKCTSASLVNTPEMGIHGFIEFGNRVLTFVLVLVVLATLVALWNLRSSRPMLFWLTFGQLASIPVQGVIGGLSVWSGLNPWVVGLHFLVSAGLVTIATLLVNRTFNKTGSTGAVLKAPIRPVLKQLALTAFVLVCIAVVIGVAVTGSGPHAGDANAPRNGLDSDLITRAHVLPVYLLVAVTLILLWLSRRRGDALRTPVWWLTAAVLVQAAIGYIQHFTGLPPFVVGMHMVGAALLLAAGVNVADVALRSRRSVASLS